MGSGFFVALNFFFFFFVPFFFFLTPLFAWGAVSGTVCVPSRVFCGLFLSCDAEPPTLMPLPLRVSCRPAPFFRQPCIRKRQPTCTRPIFRVIVFPPIISMFEPFFLRSRFLGLVCASPSLFVPSRGLFWLSSLLAQAGATS